MNPQSKSRILLADHDQTFLDQLADRLLQMNMDVDFAENGKTAMKLVESETYDLIITEIAMPVYNGLEILRKARSKNQNTPILLMSYEVTQDWAEQAMKEGAYEYLLRPLGDIGRFDIAVQRGLDIALKLQEDSSFENPFSQEVFESLPQTQVSSPFSKGRRRTEPLQRPELEIPNPTFKVPAEPSMEIEPAPWEQVQDQKSSLPEGMIELNEMGQIVSCSPPARNWLMLEANSPEKPIKGLIKSISRGKTPNHMQVQVSGRPVHLITKTIQDRSGSTRIILVIREAKAATQGTQRSASTRVPITTSPVRATVEKKVTFSSSMKKYRADVENQGWSPVGFFDQMKKSIKGEVEKIKEQNPLDLFHSEPEEADPDTVFSMSRRISDVSRGRRTSF